MKDIEKLLNLKRLKLIPKKGVKMEYIGIAILLYIGFVVAPYIIGLVVITFITIIALIQHILTNKRSN